MDRDLTAIFLRPTSSGGLVDRSGAPLAAGSDAHVASPKWTELVEGVVRGRGRPAILRIAPLPKVGLLQVEVCDVVDGLPSEDPELVAGLSAQAPATFVHVNHEAKQAILHGFDAGKPGEGVATTPGPEYEQQLRARLGCGLAELHAADDQSRVGIGVVASRTVALLPGRMLALPVGMPSALGSFVFHDRAVDHDGGAERCIFFAFDRPLPEALLSTPGQELAQIIETATKNGQTLLDPSTSAAVLGVLRGLGEKPVRSVDEASRSAVLQAIEALVLSSGRVFSAGDRVDHFDTRVLPLLALEDSPPVVGADDVEELDTSESTLHALVEIVPSRAPPGGAGSVLESFADAELAPLFPALATGGTYAGSILALDPTRLLASLRALDSAKLSRLVERLLRAWCEIKEGKAPDDAAFAAFQKAQMERGQTDTDRVLRHLSELRVVCEVAAVNDLAIAIGFYG